MDRDLDRVKMDKWLSNVRIIYASDTITVDGVKKRIHFYVKLGTHGYTYEIEVGGKIQHVTDSKSNAIGCYNELVYLVG